jgi:transposase-like protein
LTARLHAQDLIGENGLLKQLTKRLVERALEAEMADHLGHGKNKPVSNPTMPVMDEAKAWQSRPLDALYPIVIWTAYTSNPEMLGPSKSKPCI